MNQRSTLILITACLITTLTSWGAISPADPTIYLPYLSSDNGTLNRAFRIAVGDLMGNVAPHQNGLLTEPVPVVLAGLDYNRPWTRDASINAWNGASLIMPEISRNTLLSVLKNDNGTLRIGGQYWDCMVWATGAWHHYLYTGDKDFLKTALEATRNSLAYFETTEFDSKTGLFRGPGWSDGVAAYPKEYTAGTSSGIVDWPRAHPDQVVKPGYGIPMLAISTNCLYYNAYRVVGWMEQACGVQANPQWLQKAERLKESIQKYLWIPEKGYFRSLTGQFGNDDHQEALGHAYAIMFGVANKKQIESIFQNQHVAPAGVPCTWPTFPRYENEDGTSFGRHSGPVWPQIQGFWADAAALKGKRKIFTHEFKQLGEHACRDLHFAELYHPITGAMYGGMQESGSRGIILWGATKRQTWAATAYIRMVLTGVIGLRFSQEGLRFEPLLPDEINQVTLQNLHYRNMKLSITIERKSDEPSTFSVNGTPLADAFLQANGTGEMNIQIALPN